MDECMLCEWISYWRGRYVQQIDSDGWIFYEKDRYKERNIILCGSIYMKEYYLRRICKDGGLLG